MGKINNSSKVKDINNKNDDFNLEFLIISIILSFIISLISSYVITSNDEKLLTNSYWESVDAEN